MLVPSIEQIRRVVLSFGTGTDIYRRDRAQIAFALLSGSRDNAIASLAIRNVDLDLRTVFQDAQGADEESKTFTSGFFPERAGGGISS